MWFLIRAGFLMVVAELLLFGQLETAIAQTPQIADHHNAVNRVPVRLSSLSEPFAVRNFEPSATWAMPRDFWDAQGHGPVIRPHQANSPYVTNALGTRGKMAVIGAALIGTGAALVTTADRSVDVPRSCSDILFWEVVLPIQGPKRTVYRPASAEGL